MNSALYSRFSQDTAFPSLSGGGVLLSAVQYLAFLLFGLYRVYPGVLGETGIGI